MRGTPCQAKCGAKTNPPTHQVNNLAPTGRPLNTNTATRAAHRGPGAELGVVDVQWVGGVRVGGRLLLLQDVDHEHGVGPRRHVVHLRGGHCATHGRTATDGGGVASRPRYSVE